MRAKVKSGASIDQSDMEKMMGEKMQMVMKQAMMYETKSSQERERQIIFCGLKSDIDEESVVSQVKSIMQSLGVTELFGTKGRQYILPLRSG